MRGALSLAGFAVGAYVGARLAPTLLEDGSPYAPLVALGAALLAGTFLSGLAEMLGVTLRSTFGAVPGLRAVDSAAGFLLGAAAGVVLCWAIGAVLLYLPGQSTLREAVQESVILTEINDEFPPERLLETLERVDPIGVLVGPPAEVPARRTRSSPAIPTSAARRIASSASRGLACGLGVEGSGWIVRRGYVVTNAHVVAGIERPRVDRRNGDDHTASVMALDVKNDLAVLRVPGPRRAAAAVRRSRARRAGRAHRLPRERPAPADPGPARGDELVHQPRRVRQRAGDEDGDCDPRDGPAGALRRARRRRERARADDGVRAPARGGRRLRDPARRSCEKVLARGDGRRRGGRQRLREVEGRGSPRLEQVECGERLPERRDHVDAGRALARLREQLAGELEADVAGVRARVA